MMSSVIFLWGKQAHKGRCGRQRSWLKPPDCDCWVSGERFGFFRCEAAGADETEQKHLLGIFERLRTQSVLVGLLPFKPSETRKAESNYWLARSERGVSPSPSEGRTEAYITNVARPSGRCISSLNLKERKKHIVKPKHKVIRKYGYRLFCRNFCKSLILLTLWFFLNF